MSVKNSSITQPATFSFEKESPSSEPSRFTKWIGIQDFSAAYQDCKEKNYVTAAKSGALGLLKLGVAGAALYGIYCWAFPRPVFLSDVLYQAGQEAAQNSQSGSVPPSVQKLTETLYREQPQYRRWPESVKEFIVNHLNSNDPVSSAIIVHFLAEAALREDSSLKQMVLKVCKTAQTTAKSCLAALQHFIGLPATPDTLENAMKIVGQCNKNTNAYCIEAFQGAQQQSLELHSLDDVLTLVRKIKYFPGNHLPFLEKAIDFFNTHLAEKERILQACETAKSSPEATSLCNEQADFMEKMDYLDIQLSQWRPDTQYFQKRVEKSRKEVTDLLTGYGVNLGEACLRFSGSEKCTHFVDQLAKRLLENGLVEEGIGLVTKMGGQGAAENYLPPLLDTLVAQQKWAPGTLLCAKLLKNNPSAPIQKAIHTYWVNLLASSEAHRGVELLEHGTAPPDLLAKTVEKVFSSGNRDAIAKLYTIAKTWITETEIKNQPQLTAIINALFEVPQTRWDAPHEHQMAKVLATLWIKAKKPNAYTYSDLRRAWNLDHIPGCLFDQFASHINKDNWQDLIPKEGIVL